LVSYVELGHHYPIYQGKRQVYDQGKNAGKEKAEDMVIHMTFEFSTYEYTGSNPLTISYSTPFGAGEFINKLAMGKSLEEGWCSRKMALKTNYVKMLMAMQKALGTGQQFHEMVGEVFGCTVQHKLGKKAREDGTIPVYTNVQNFSFVKPEFKNPADGKITVVPCPDKIADYCSVFDWANPTIEGWALLPKRLQKACQGAMDYNGSPLHMMLTEYSANTPDIAGDDASAPEAPEETQGKPAVADEPIDDIPV